MLLAAQLVAWACFAAGRPALFSIYGIPPGWRPGPKDRLFFQFPPLPLSTWPTVRARALPFAVSIVTTSTLTLLAIHFWRRRLRTTLRRMAQIRRQTAAARRAPDAGPAPTGPPIFCYARDPQSPRSSLLEFIALTSGYLSLGSGGAVCLGAHGGTPIVVSVILSVTAIATATACTLLPDGGRLRLLSADRGALYGALGVIATVMSWAIGY